MKIELEPLRIRDVFEKYKNEDEEGVRAFNGNLNIRPPYQREFVYKDNQRNAVIETIQKGFPLNVMYWCRNDDGTYEVLDGQQRLISIGEYLRGAYSINYRGFYNLTQSECDQILDYELMIYICEGDEKEKLDWFRTINIAGEKLTDQELLNAMYTGPWLMDAKRHFSKTGCAAYNLAKEYVKGAPIRQEYLETAIDWISNGNIQEYMSKHQHDPNANELWLHFNSVITWVKTVFPKYRKEMKGVNWGDLYNRFKDLSIDSKAVEQRISELMMDDDVTRKAGIYEYVLSGDERCLSIRAFTDSMKRSAYERQNGMCPRCQKQYEISGMQGDHITPWCEGGTTTLDNCQMLCADCNRRKSGK